MHFPEGFMLGLSTGVVCLAYCGPVLIPFLLGEGNTIAQNTMSVTVFLGGRLMAYILTGFFSGLLGAMFIHPSQGKTVIFGIIYIFLALFLLSYGFYRFKEICLGQRQLKQAERKGFGWPMMMPLTGGFASGLNLCPPFLLAITGAMEGQKISGGVLFFIMFFLGTSVYFVPLPFIGFFRRRQVLRVIGKFAAILAGVFYLYKGFLMIV